MKLGFPENKKNNALCEKINPTTFTVVRKEPKQRQSGKG